MADCRRTSVGLRAPCLRCILEYALEYVLACNVERARFFSLSMQVQTRNLCQGLMHQAFLLKFVEFGSRSTAAGSLSTMARMYRRILHIHFVGLVSKVLHNSWVSTTTSPLPVSRGSSRIPSESAFPSIAFVVYMPIVRASHNGRCNAALCVSTALQK